MNSKDIFECVGRMIILTLIAFAVNRTEWYQNLPVQTLTSTEPITWIFCILLVLSFFWIGLPIIKFNNDALEKNQENNQTTEKEVYKNE